MLMLVYNPKSAYLIGAALSALCTMVSVAVDDMIDHLCSPMHDDDTAGWMQSS